MARKTTLLAFLGLTVALGLVYYDQYVKRRHCFNELGRCFDEESGIVYTEQSGLVWLTMAVLALAVSVVLAWSAMRSDR